EGYKLVVILVNDIISLPLFTMAGEKATVTAVFALIETSDESLPDESVPDESVPDESVPDESVSGAAHSITVVQASHGKITVDKTSAVKGETVKATYTPDSGYELKRIIINNAIVSRATFAMPDIDVVVTGLFVLKSTEAEKEKHTVTVTVVGQGSALANCSDAYEGDSVMIDVMSADGFVFQSISFNGTTYTDESPRYTLTMPDNDVEITVVFTEIDDTSPQESSDETPSVSSQESTATEVSIITVVSNAGDGMSGGVKAAIYIVPLLLIASIAVMLLMRQRI
ncbi:MAG TPA: hypothetical protein PLT66_07315, partial [Bacillota bacterium]|nr:hypothetical protein [Bacillota bacterium]